MKATYYNSAEQVIFPFSPMTRFMSKIFGKELFVVKCKNCKKIPTELYGAFCIECSKK
jgi:hypothetical protein